MGITQEQIVNSAMKHIHGKSPSQSDSSCPANAGLCIEDIAASTTALLILPPHSTRSVILQYPTSTTTSSSATIGNVNSGTHSVVGGMNLLWGACDLSRKFFSSNNTSTLSSGADHCSHLLSTMRFGEVPYAASTSQAQQARASGQQQHPQQILCCWVCFAVKK